MSRRKGPSSHPLAAVPQTAAWASNEHILPGASDAGKSAGRDGGGIVVAQEINVQSQAASEANSLDVTKNPAAHDWGYKTSVSRSP
jgi:hypothetical protein